jgi:hypothetical protein
MEEGKLKSIKNDLSMIHRLIGKSPYLKLTELIGENRWLLSDMEHIDTWYTFGIAPVSITDEHITIAIKEKDPIAMEFMEEYCRQEAEECMDSISMELQRENPHAGNLQFFLKRYGKCKANQYLIGSNLGKEYGPAEFNKPLLKLPDTVNTIKMSKRER